MTQRASVLAGLGGILFGPLWLAGAFIGNPPGGSYAASDVTDFVAKGHRGHVVLALVVCLVSTLALLMLLAGLRDRVAGDSFVVTMFRSTGVIAVAGFAIGWMGVFAVPMALLYGGADVTVDPAVIYLLVESGWIILFGAGGVFLGLAMIAAMLGSKGTLPAWHRWFTLIAGVLGLLALAWFPFFAMLIWALVTGLWLLASGMRTAS